jgi:predicted N-acetyltransferase YhbS
MTHAAPAESWSVRPATDDDYDAIVEVWRRSGMDVRLSGREGRSAYRLQLARFADSYLVAVDGAAVIGVVLGTHDHRKGWSNRLAVHPAYQRRGVAAALVGACESALRRHGLGIVAALVEPDRRTSASLFRSLGYATDVPLTYFRKPFDPQA